MKIDLGGGRIPRPGHVNVDLLPCADVVLNLEDVGRGVARLPFRDNTVDVVYSSHCFEHVDPYNGVLLEIARVCRLGAKVEIRTPHPNSDMACIAGHKHVLSEQQVRQWEEFAEDWWPNVKKMLKLREVVVVPAGGFAEVKQLFLQLSDEFIHRHFRNTAHENRFHFEVVNR